MQRVPNMPRRGSLPSAQTIAGLMLGLAIGIAAGLIYAWQVNPVVHTDVAPWQLDNAGQTNWLIAVGVAWAHDGDVLRAANRLNDLHWGSNTFQRVANTACDLARTSYAQSQTGLIAIRSLANLAAGQGKIGCASTLVPLSTFTPAPSPTVITATPTLAPPSTKTPTPAPGPTFTPATAVPPTATVVFGSFRVVRTDSFCSAKTPGVIEILVQAPDATGIPGVAVRIDSSTGADQFFTGLEPERDPGFADFRMQPDITYTVSLPSGSDRSQPFKAQPCTDKTSGGVNTVASYRVYFRRVAN
jgi:hypothetical protein